MGDIHVAPCNILLLDRSIVVCPYIVEVLLSIIIYLI